MQIPGWFRVFFAAVMLMLCVFISWFAITSSMLIKQQQQLVIMVTTSRQRQTKQNVEYEAVVAQIPGVKAQLEQIQPLADDEKAKEKVLREQRKQLRKNVTELTDAVTKLQSINTQLKAMVDATDAILQKINQLQ